MGKVDSVGGGWLYKNKNDCSVTNYGCELDDDLDYYMPVKGGRSYLFVIHVMPKVSSMALSLSAVKYSSEASHVKSVYRTDEFEKDVDTFTTALVHVPIGDVASYVGILPYLESETEGHTKYEFACAELLQEV